MSWEDFLSKYDGHSLGSWAEERNLTEVLSGPLGVTTSLRPGSGLEERGLAAAVAEVCQESGGGDKGSVVLEGGMDGITRGLLKGGSGVRYHSKVTKVEDIEGKEKVRVRFDCQGVECSEEMVNFLFIRSYF